jgi:hypothetical protein
VITPPGAEGVGTGEAGGRAGDVGAGGVAARGAGLSSLRRQDHESPTSRSNITTRAMTRARLFKRLRSNLESLSRTRFTGTADTT